KELIRRQRRVKEEEKEAASRQPQPDRRRNRELPASVGSHMNKVKISHGRKTAAHQKRVAAGNILNPNLVWTKRIEAWSGKSKPTLPTFYVNADELFIGFGEVHNAFN